MHKRPGEEDEESQRVDNNRDMDTDHGERTTERPDQPDTKPRTETRTASILLGDESTSEKKCKKRQETLHRGAE